MIKDPYVQGYGCNSVWEVRYTTYESKRSDRGSEEPSASP